MECLLRKHFLFWFKLFRRCCVDSGRLSRCCWRIPLIWPELAARSEILALCRSCTYFPHSSSAAWTPHWCVWYAKPCWDVSNTHTCHTLQSVQSEYFTVLLTVLAYCQLEVQCLGLSVFVSFKGTVGIFFFLPKLNVMTTLSHTGHYFEQEVVVGAPSVVCWGKK